MKKIFFVILLFLMSISFVYAKDLKIPVDYLFYYDYNLPLHIKENKRKETDNYIQYHITFSSAHREKVPALFTLPKKGTPPYPVIILQHGWKNSKEGFNGFFTDFFTKESYALISIDAPFHGERKRSGYDLFSPYVFQTRDMMIQGVIDLRRAIDFLLTKKEIDCKRIGFLGESMGAVLGCMFVSLDDRVKVPVLVVGGGDFSSLGKIFIGFIGKENMNQFGTTMLFLDPLNYVERISPRPLLMINASRDELISKESTLKLYSKAKNPKKIIWINSGHSIPSEQICPSVLDWFSEYLK